jgi:hypothetical protein
MHCLRRQNRPVRISLFRPAALLLHAFHSDTRLRYILSRFFWLVYVDLKLHWQPLKQRTSLFGLPKFAFAVSSSSGQIRLASSGEGPVTDHSNSMYKYNPDPHRRGALPFKSVNSNGILAKLPGTRRSEPVWGLGIDHAD